MVKGNGSERHGGVDQLGKTASGLHFSERQPHNVSVSTSEP